MKPPWHKLSFRLQPNYSLLRTFRVILRSFPATLYSIICDFTTQMPQCVSFAEACFAFPLLFLPRRISHFADAIVPKRPLPHINYVPRCTLDPSAPSSPLTLQTSRRFCLTALLAVLLHPTPSLCADTSDPSSPTNKAIEELRKITALQDLAFEFTNQQKFPQAEYVWTKLIYFNEQNAAAFSNRGNCRTSQGKFEMAIADFNRAIELAPDEPDPFLGKGVALEGLRQFDDALNCYSSANQRSVTKYGGEDPVAINNMGNARAGLGDWQGAFESFKKAAEMNSRFVFPLANEALVLYQMGREEEALRTMRFLTRKYPSFGDMHAALAMVAWTRGDQAQAENEWYKAVEQDAR